MDMICADGYFVTYDYPPYVHETPNEVALEKSLKGKVEFDFGVVEDPSTGLHVWIHGEFPRIHPRHQSRGDVYLSPEFKELRAKLTAWTNTFLETTKQPTYIEKLVDTCSLFTVYVNPFHKIDEERMELVMINFFWLWHADDVFEMAFKHNIPFHIIDKGMMQLLSILNDEPKEFAEVEGCPGFRILYNSLIDIHARLNKHNHYHKDVSGPFRLIVRRYFESMKWYLVERIGKEYSEETFKFWRRQIAFCDLFTKVIMMVNGVVLPDYILISPLLRRIFDIANSSCGFVNDVLGLTKELKYGQEDNLVLFKVHQKGIPMSKAVTQVCELITGEHTDYILLRDAILLKFRNNPDLVKCIDVLESMMDGHCRIYEHSQRHLSAGKVKLTR